MTTNTDINVFIKHYKCDHNLHNHQETEVSTALKEIWCAVKHRLEIRMPAVNAADNIDAMRQSTVSVRFWISKFPFLIIHKMCAVLKNIKYGVLIKIVPN